MRQRYDEAVAAKSTDVDASIAGLIAQAEALSQAPESVEHGELLELAGAWRGVEVTAGNLADAVQAEARLAELAGTVVAQQEQAAEAERAHHAGGGRTEPTAAGDSRIRRSAVAAARLLAVRGTVRATVECTGNGGRRRFAGTGRKPVNLTAQTGRQESRPVS